jgi:hypothetical protein
MGYFNRTRGVMMRKNSYEIPEIVTFYLMVVTDLHTLVQQQTNIEFDGSKNPLIKFMHDTDNLIYLPFNKPFELEKGLMLGVIHLPIMFQSLSHMFHKSCRAMAVPVSLLQIVDEEVKLEQMGKNRDTYLIKDGVFVDTGPGMAVRNKSGVDKLVSFRPIYDPEDKWVTSSIHVSDVTGEPDETLAGSSNVAEFVKRVLQIELWPIVTDKSQIEFAQKFADTVGCPVLVYKTPVVRPGWFMISTGSSENFEIFSTTPSSHVSRSHEL